jgi:hypothetical protein
MRQFGAHCSILLVNGRHISTQAAATRFLWLSRRDVMWLILVQGARLALAGLAIGALAAFGFTRLISSLLYGISASDPLTFAAVAMSLSPPATSEPVAPWASIPWSPFGTNDPSGQVSAKASFRTTPHGRQVLV